MDRRPPRRKVQQKQRKEEEIAIDILRRGDLWFHIWELREIWSILGLKRKGFYEFQIWGACIYLWNIYIY